MRRSDINEKQERVEAFTWTDFHNLRDCYFVRALGAFDDAIVAPCSGTPTSENSQIFLFVSVGAHDRIQRDEASSQSRSKVPFVRNGSPKGALGNAAQL